MTLTDRYNTLAAESTQAFLDSAYLAQRQNAQFIQSWFGVIEDNQKISRELVGRLVKHGQEARSLWYELWQEGFRNSTELFVKAADTASENVHKAGQQMANGTAKVKETVAAK